MRNGVKPIGMSSIAVMLGSKFMPAVVHSDVLDNGARQPSGSAVHTLVMPAGVHCSSGEFHTQL
jgi:hypothetical protein